MPSAATVRRRSPIHPPASGRRTRFFALGVVTSVGLLHAASYAHVTSDDAFISLRYAAHLAEGVGLVYNPGQAPVEGFSNPLFTLVSALLIRLGVPALIAAKALGLLGLGVALLLLPALVRGLLPGAGALSAIAAPALLAASAHPAVSAMTGLETTLHMGVVLVAVLVSVREVARGRVRLGPLAWLAVALSRPEGALLAAGAAAAQWLALGLDRRVVARWTVGFAAPALLLLGARYAYFGALVPNTFYAKVGVGGVGRQRGLDYLADFVVGGGAWVVLPAVVGFGVLAATGGVRRLSVALAVIAVQAAYVLLVGEDFMLGNRFIMPVYPLLCAGAALLLAKGVLRLPAWRAGPVRGVALGVLCAGAMVSQSLELASHPVRYWLIRNAPGISYLGRTDLRGTYLAAHQAVGTYLREHAAPGDRLVVSEAGVIPFYAELTTLDLFGLTDRALASLWSDARGGRVGELREGMARQVFAAEPRWIVLDAHRGPDGKLELRLQVARWLLRHPDWKLYRPVFRAVVYRGEPLGFDHDRIDLVFERREAAPAGDAEPGPPAPSAETPG